MRDRHHTRMTRRTNTLLCIALALALCLVPSAVGADARGATIDKTGWWSRPNTTVPTPAAPVTVPPPPGIPEGDLAVGYAGGTDPSAIAAVGIKPEEGPGATVTRATLTISEDPDAGGNVNTSSASIMACPITAFWAGGDNGAWDTRPDHDCEAAAVEGERANDGTWTFDLTPIATLWFDTFSTILADGVVLKPLIGPQTQPFQAVFQGGDAIDVVIEAEPGPDDGGFDFDTPTTQPPSGDGGFGGGDDFSSGSDFDAPDSGSFEPPPSPDVTAAPEPDAGSTDDETATPPAAEGPDTEPVASRAGDIFGNLSPLVYVGLLAFAGILLTMSYWLGPNGQPVTTIRQRGVSRALDARTRARKGA